MPTQYPLTPGSLASNCWPAAPQTLYNEMFQKGYVTLDLQGVIMSQAAPGATDRDKLWVKLDISNQPVGIFKFQGGNWIWPHEIPPSDKRLIPFYGSAAEIITLDGGEAGAISTTTGAFWQEHSTIVGRVPIGVGLIPGSDPAVTTAVEDTGGAAQVEMDATHLAPHQHIVPACAIASNTTDPAPTGSPATVQYGIGKDQGTGRVIDSTSGDWERAFPLTSEAPDTTVTPQEGLPIMPPYYAVYFLKRTIRQFRRG